MAGRIDLVCVTDSNYVPHVASLLKSIECNKGPEEICVHAILDDVAPELVAQLAAAVPGLTLRSYPVTEHPALSLPPILQISRATYLRLIIDEVIDPGLERLLYLDIDMTVTGRLWPLWTADLAGQPCGAVADPGVAPEVFAERFGLAGKGGYFNAGMLVLDMAAIRREGLFAKALAELLENPARFVLADQDALNLALWQRWTALDPCWNFQRKFLYPDVAYGSDAAPRIIHFTETAKPWQAAEWHPQAWLYWKYLRKTPFAARVAAAEGINGPRLAKFWLKYLARARFA